MERNARCRKQFDRGVHAIAMSSEANIHDGKIGVLRPANFHGFFRRCGASDDLDSGAGQLMFEFESDEVIVLYEQNARPTPFRPTLNIGRTRYRRWPAPVPAREGLWVTDFRQLDFGINWLGGMGAARVAV